MSDLQLLQKELRQVGDTERAHQLKGYFKEPKAGYPVEDKFYGITVPISRDIARKYTTLSLENVEELLVSPFHEERLIALLILVQKFQKGTDNEKRDIYHFYLAHTDGVNNWDLVDLSADKIVGNWLLSHSEDKDILIRFANSKIIWERRIAMIATFAWIRIGEVDVTLKIAELLVHDKEDLIHKAVGWMLREAGKRVSQKKEEEFLKKHYRTMPRTMLRYAIERFPEDLRKSYLLGKI